MPSSTRRPLVSSYHISRKRQGRMVLTADKQKCLFFNNSPLERDHWRTEGVVRYFGKARRRYFSFDSSHASSERPNFSRSASIVTPARSCSTAKVSRRNCRVTRF